MLFQFLDGDSAAAEYPHNGFGNAKLVFTGEFRWNRIAQSRLRSLGILCQLRASAGTRKVVDGETGAEVPSSAGQPIPANSMLA